MASGACLMALYHSICVLDEKDVALGRKVLLAHAYNIIAW
jgi:hypothetical protein